MRSLALYARSRRLPLTVLAIVATATAFWGLGVVVEEFDARLLTALGAATGAAVAGPGLGAVELERAAALRWPRRRAAHLVAVAVVTLAAVGAIAASGDQPASLVVREAVGLSGLVALGAVVLGAERAWLVPVAWTLAAWTLPAAVTTTSETTASTAYRVLTWVAEPAGSAPANAAAWVLAAAGLGLYAWRGFPGLRVGP